jgi:hypothetical protein
MENFQFTTILTYFLNDSFLFILIRSRSFTTLTKFCPLLTTYPLDRLWLIIIGKEISLILQGKLHIVDISSIYRLK